jgi:hypothetical protein
LVAERLIEGHSPCENGATEKLDYAIRKWWNTFGLERIGACGKKTSIEPLVWFGPTPQLNKQQEN